MTSNISGFPLLAAEHKLNTLKEYIDGNSEAENLDKKIRETITQLRENDNTDLTESFSIVRAVGSLQSFIKSGEHRYITQGYELCTPCSTIKEEYLKASQGVM